MATKRGTKFYRKNEAEVMKDLGLEPTKNSGSGWVEKSDGQSEHVICELKSTDARSIKVNQQDLHILEYNASTTNKIPVFAIQFLQSNEVWLLVKPDALQDAAKYLETGKYNIDRNAFIGVDMAGEDTQDVTTYNMIKSSENAREDFKAANGNKYKKGERKAK